MSQIRQLDCSNQHFYIGLDVHAKSWDVTLRSNQMVLTQFSMKVDPAALYGYMVRHYPGGIYHSVYEAGFCGFWIHRQLSMLGFLNRVVNAADVPTSHKEKDRKRDRVDSGKLARELEKGSLEAIYVPTQQAQQLRSLVRLRHSQVKQMTRLKNTIKSFLHYNGIPLPAPSELRHWSRPFLSYLSSLEFDEPAAADYLHFNLKALENQRAVLLDTVRRLRQYSREPHCHDLIHCYLISIPGIAFISAMILYSEIIDIHRFPTLDHLKSYVGLVPSVAGTSDRNIQKGLTSRRNAHLRHIIIEAAWIAARKDPVMVMTFGQLCQRMPRQEAIIRIARKLLSRIRHVWIRQTPYQKGVMQ